jgi:predicted dehydrogenase
VELEQTMHRTDTIGVGVIGFGYWGPNLARNLSMLHLDGVELRAIADLDPTRRMRATSMHPMARIVDNAEDVILNGDIDAVVIATPVDTHYDLVRKALAAGKHVLVEKPLAATVGEAIELSALADRLGLILMVGHVFEYTEAVRYIRDTVASGGLGDILYIRSLRVNLGIYQRDINVLWDLAPHDVSIINYVLGGEPESVSAVGRAHITEGVPDIVNLNLYFGDRTLVTVVVSWLDPRKIREMTIIGAQKMLVYDDVSATDKIRVYDKGVDGPADYDSFGDFHYSYRYGDITSPMIEHREPLRSECEHFIGCIRHGKQPRSDGASGVRVVRTLAAAQASLDRAGETVSLEDPMIDDISAMVGGRRGAA